MSWVYRLFMALAAVGLALSLLVHLSAILGVPQPLGPSAWMLHLGVFVVWIPTMVVGFRLIREVGFDRKDYWKIALRGAPRWLRWAAHGVFVYTFLNFILCIPMLPPKKAAAAKKPPGFQDAPAAVWRMFSGHWMAFYAVSFATLYSAAVVSAQECDGRKPLKKPDDEVDGWLS
ncbi:hypothetical protein [Paludisphaera rhizosphaerae]|nr:hypothetical protein [Paludisphaera rhizosphaerae]